MRIRPLPVEPEVKERCSFLRPGKDLQDLAAFINLNGAVTSGAEDRMAFVVTCEKKHEDLVSPVDRSDAIIGLNRPPVCFFQVLADGAK